MKPPSAPSPDKYSDWDDALAFVPPPAAKQRLPFSDTPGKRNVSLVPQVKGTSASHAMTQGRISRSGRQWIIAYGFVRTHHRGAPR